jgi:hypothetical protein
LGGAHRADRRGRKTSVVERRADLVLPPTHSWWWRGRGSPGIGATVQDPRGATARTPTVAAPENRIQDRALLQRDAAPARPAASRRGARSRASARATPTDLPGSPPGTVAGDSPGFAGRCDRRFGAAGLDRASPDLDSENPPGALALYEKMATRASAQAWPSTQAWPGTRSCGRLSRPHHGGDGRRRGGSTARGSGQ